MKETTRPDAIASIIAARRAAADTAAAQPKRKRKPSRPTRRDPVPVIAAPPIERRGAADLERLGESMLLAEVVAEYVDKRRQVADKRIAQRRAELDDIAALMTGKPRPR